MPHYVLKVSKTGRILKKVCWCPTKRVATAICREQAMVCRAKDVRFETALAD